MRMPKSDYRGELLSRKALEGASRKDDEGK